MLIRFSKRTTLHPLQHLQLGYFFNCSDMYGKRVRVMHLFYALATLFRITSDHFLDTTYSSERNMLESFLLE